MAIIKTKALVDLGMAKLYLGNAALTADDRLIDMCAGQASIMVRRAVGCDILDTAYMHELHDADDGTLLFLNNWPVIDVRRASVGRDLALRVTYGGSSPMATARITDNALILRNVANGGFSDLTFPLSDYNTITELASAVTANGWVGVSIDTYGSWPAIDLLPYPAISARNKSMEFPVPQESEVEYEIQDPDYGVLYNPYGWNAGGWQRSRRYVSIDYRAGYARENIPEPIQAAVLQTAAALFRVSQRDTTLQSETIGSYSWGAADMSKIQNGLDKLADSTLAPYRRLMIGGEFRPTGPRDISTDRAQGWTDDRTRSWLT